MLADVFHEAALSPTALAVVDGKERLVGILPTILLLNVMGGARPRGADHLTVEAAELHPDLVGGGAR